MKFPIGINKMVVQQTEKKRKKYVIDWRPIWVEIQFQES